MNCLEFKRLALSDPNSRAIHFVAHTEQCEDCLQYVVDVRRMDAELSTSLEVSAPSDLAARLRFNSEMFYAGDENNSRRAWGRFAIAGGLAVMVLVAGLMLRGQFSHQQQLVNDYQKLLAGVLEHVDEHPITPVWDTTHAHQRVNSLLATYEEGMQLEGLKDLQFGRICPMGQYLGLHATLESGDSQTTFAYIKGMPVDDLLDSNFSGYKTRIKPVKGGNLIIFSRSQQALDEAAANLHAAMVWDS